VSIAFINVSRLNESCWFLEWKLPLAALHHIVKVCISPRIKGCPFNSPNSNYRVRDRDRDRIRVRDRVRVRVRVRRIEIRRIEKEPIKVFIHNLTCP